jgi:hypothetical protein
MFCEHNEKLASHDQKKIKIFVMLIFLFFSADSLGDFFYFHIIRENGNFGNTKTRHKICLQRM